MGNEKSGVDRIVRVGEIRGLIDHVMPSLPVDHYCGAIARMMKADISRLDDEDRGWAGYVQKGDDNTRRRVASVIEGSDMQTNEVGDYLDVVVTLEGITRQTDINFFTSYERMGRIVERVRDPKRASLLLNMAQQWNERYLGGNILEEEKNRRKRDFEKLVDSLLDFGISPRRPERSDDEIVGLFGAVVEVYDLAYSLSPSSEDEDGRIVKSMIEAAKQSGLDRHSPEQTRGVLSIFETMADRPFDRHMDKFVETVRYYSTKYPFSEGTVGAFVDVVYPQMVDPESEIAFLMEDSNMWSTKDGTFGIADFYCHCLTQKVTPGLISQLVVGIRELPTSDFAILNQNRKDGLSLMNYFPHLRDELHDESTNAHRLVGEMVAYFETKDSDELEITLRKMNFTDEEVAKYLDLKKYEDMAVDRIGEEWIQDADDSKLPRMRVIDMLRRTVTNTEAVGIEPPKTGVMAMDRVIHRLTGPVELDDVGLALDVINQQLLNMIADGRVGISPKIIETTVWLERVVAGRIQRMSLEEQVAAYKQEWFSSALLFEELLTASGEEFDDVEFEAYVSRVRDANDYEEAYRLVIERSLRRVDVLAVGKRRLGLDPDILWSGNLTDAFVSLNETKQSKTKYGERYSKDRLKRKIEDPYYHPGD